MRKPAWLTYANTTATLAVFMAMGGVSYAAVTVTGQNIKNSSVTGKDVKNKSLTKKDFKGSVRGARGPAGAAGQPGAKGDKGNKGDAGTPATKLFAAVDEAGTLGKNSGATSATKTSTGFYNVVFNQNISGCVYLATVGADSFSASPAIISTTITGTSTVTVRSVSDAGAAFDRPFYLAVFC